MTSQTAREALIEELLSAWPYGEDIAGVGEHYICAAILPLIARIEAEALARGRTRSQAMNIEDDEYCTADYGAFGNLACSCSSCNPPIQCVSKAEHERSRRAQERRERERRVSSDFNLHMINLYNARAKL